jgi:hypothetical protein
MVRALFAALALLVALPAFAAEVRLVVPYRTMELGQVVGVEVQVINGRVAVVPKLAAGDGLLAAFHSQGTTTRIVNRNSTTIRSFTFQVQAVQEGATTLGPATVEVDGKQVTTNQVALQIEPPPPTLEQDLLVYAEASVPEAWEGQVVLYRYGVRSRKEPLRIGWITLPVTSLARPKQANDVQRQYAVQDERGVLYVNETLQPFLVTGATDLELTAATAQVSVAKEGNSSRMRLFQPTDVHTRATQPTTLKVRRLPPSPPGFTGLVGEFEVRTSVATDSAQVGESVDLVVRIAGDGALDGFSLPQPANLQGARIYDGSPTVQAEVTADGYRTVGQFNRVLVPTDVGILKPEPLALVTFSPSRGEYVTHRVVVPPITVAAGKEGAGPDGGLESFAPAEGAREDEGPVVVDIYPVRQSGRATTPNLGALLPWGLGGLLWIGALLGALEARDWWRRRPRPETVVHKAAPSARLRALPEAPAERLETLDEALRDAVAERLSLAPAEVDRRAAEQLPSQLGHQVKQAVLALERARFADEPPGPDLAAQVQAAVDALEAA